ncbi:MAG: hypothetical protein ACLQAT_28790 [Candidatus Binataceae bacterium]
MEIARARAGIGFSAHKMSESTASPPNIGSGPGARATACTIAPAGAMNVSIPGVKKEIPVKTCNRYSDCVTLEMKPEQTNSAIDVDIKVNFAEAWGQVMIEGFDRFKTSLKTGVLRNQWKFKFGVSELELKCLLDNLTSHYRNFRQPLPLNDKVQFTVKTEAASQASESDSSTIGVEVSLQPKLTAGSQITGSTVSSTGSATERSYEIPKCVIHSKGLDSSPKWDFESNTRFLEGFLEDRLATFTFLDSTRPYRIEFLFQLRSSALCVLAVDDDTFASYKPKTQSNAFTTR